MSNNTTKMKKKIIWRLANRPTSSEIIDLLNAGLLTKDESREILLTEETEEKVSEDSLKSEIKFLRELVEKLARSSQVPIVETIRYVEKPYRQYDWYRPYATWCGGGATSITLGTGGASYTGTTRTPTSGTGPNTGFSGISTF